MLDSAILLVLGLYVLLGVTFGYLFLAIRRIRRTFKPDGILGDLTAKAKAWMFVETGKTPDGKTVMSTSPQFRELVGLAVPEFIGQGLLWAKQNVKIGDVAPVLGAGQGFQLPAEVLKQLPKEIRGYVPLLLQFGPKLMSMLGIGKPAAPVVAASASSMKVLGGP